MLSILPQNIASWKWGLRWWHGKILNIPPPMNTPNLQLHVYLLPLNKDL